MKITIISTITNYNIIIINIMCHSHDKEHDDDQHPHFFCEVCQQTYCLDYAEVPEVRLPEGFEAHSKNLMLKGICPHCKK